MPREARVPVPAFRGMSLNEAERGLHQPALLVNGYVENGVIYRRPPIWRPSTTWDWPDGATEDRILLGLQAVRDDTDTEYLIAICAATVKATGTPVYRFRVFRGRHKIVDEDAFGVHEARAPSLDRWFTFAQLYGRVYATNGDGPIQVFRQFDLSAEETNGVPLEGGVVIEELTAVDRDERQYRTARDDPGPYMPRVPRGQIVFAHEFRLFVAGNVDDPQRLRWSNLGDPRGWPYSNVHRFSTGDGDPITALAAYNEDVHGGLLVFTRRGIWLVRGDYVSAERTEVERIVAGVGTPSHRLVTSANGKVHFLGTDGNLYALVGRTPIRLADRAGLRFLLAPQASGRRQSLIDYSTVLATAEALHRASLVHYAPRNWLCLHNPSNGTVPNTVLAVDLDTQDAFIYATDVEAAAVATGAANGTDFLWAKANVAGNIRLLDIAAGQGGEDAHTMRVILGPFFRSATSRRQFEDLHLHLGDTYNPGGADGTLRWWSDGRLRSTHTFPLAKSDRRTFADAQSDTYGLRLGVNDLHAAGSHVARIELGDTPLGRDLTVEVRSSKPMQLLGIEVPNIERGDRLDQQDGG